MKRKEKPLKHRFKSIYVFSEFDVEKKRDFIAAAISELGNVLITKKINLMYGGGVKEIMLVKSLDLVGVKKMIE